MSRLPDWLHSWRWYAATVIIEALFRHAILGDLLSRNLRRGQLRPVLKQLAQ
jgi:hypothetical protein